MDIKFVVPHMYTGCYIFDTVMESSIEDFYSEDFIETFRKFLDIRANLTNEYYGKIYPLDIDRNSAFPINVSTKSLIEKLFIEKWSTSLFYEQYFSQCQPLSCSYTLIKRSNIIHIATYIIGLFGGLSMVCRLISPWIISCVTRCKRSQSPSQQGKILLFVYSSETS